MDGPSIGLLYLFPFAFSEHTGVYEDTSQPIADGLADQRGHHRRIDAAADKTGHPLFTYSLLYRSNRLLDKRLRCPVACAPTYIKQEVVQDLQSLDRMRSLGMKLNAKYKPMVMTFYSLDDSVRSGRGDHQTPADPG